MSRSRKMVWIVWIVASIFYAYQYVLRVLPNILLEDILQKFDIGAGAFGQFAGIYYIGYSLFHLPIGILLDRYGPRKIMSLCILLSVVGLLPLLYSDYWVYPILGRLLIGIGSSAAILGVFKIVRMTFSEARFPRMLSFSVTIGLLGAIYGGAPVSYMHETFGYQFVLQTFAIVGIILAAITYWIVPELERSKTSENTVLSHIREVFRNPRVILCSLFAGIMVGPLEGFADVWGGVFLKQVYGFEETLAASLPSMIFIGMCFGAPVLNLIAEKVKSYLGTIIGAGIVMALSFALLLRFSLSTGFLSLDFLLVGGCCAYQILAIYQASTYVREQVAGLTTAVANMIIMIFGYAFHSVMGGIINATGGTSSSEALRYGIVVIPIALCLGVAGFCFLFTQRKRT